MFFSERFAKYLSYCLVFTLLLWVGCQGSATHEETTTKETETSEEAAPQKQEQQSQQETEQQSSQQMPPQQQIQAAEDVSDTELQQFVDAVKEIQTIQQGGQSKMMEAIKKEGMEVERFNQIMQQKKSNPNDTSLSAEEEEQFNRVNQQLQEVQRDLQGQSEQAIKDIGLSIERYQAIMKAVQQNQALQKQVQQMMQGS